MKAFYYDITIQNDPVHSYTSQTIKEIYVDLFSLYFNRKSVFIDDKKRFEKAKNIKEIDIDKDMVWMFVRKLETDKKINELQCEIFDNQRNKVCKKCKYNKNDICKIESPIYKQMNWKVPIDCPLNLKTKNKYK